jgi:hypothetical protein
VGADVTPVAINRDSGLVLCEDGSILEVAVWFGPGGRRLPDGEGALACVIETDEGWVVVDLRCFDAVSVH